MKKQESKKKIYIGTSGWHYSHWLGVFYPPDVKEYNELKFYAEHFGTVENNSSFYRVAKESTYKTWARMTPDGFTFSLKLNRFVTHIHRLQLTEDVQTRTRGILQSIQVLGDKLGAIVIQLPPSFKMDMQRVEAFLEFITAECQALQYPPDLAIEFRNASWFTKEVYEMLKKYNVALVAAQSSRYPNAQEITANICYIRLHGPEKLFASSYSAEQLKGWADYLKNAMKKVDRAYVYFNNDIGGYALTNAAELQKLVAKKKTP